MSEAEESYTGMATDFNLFYHVAKMTRWLKHHNWLPFWFLPEISLFASFFSLADMWHKFFQKTYSALQGVISLWSCVLAHLAQVWKKDDLVSILGWPGLEQKGKEKWEFSLIRHGTCVSCIGRQILYQWATSQLPILNTLENFMLLAKCHMRVMSKMTK